MKKVYLKRIICIILMIAICFVYIVISGRYVFYSDTDTQSRFDGFYLEDPNTIDVALVGSSEIYNDFCSPFAYSKYGFTSYPLGSPGQNGHFYKYEIEEILKYQSPKLFIVEVNGFLYDGEISDPQIRMISENMRLSPNKISLLSSVDCKEETYSYYFPFFKYHNSISPGAYLYNIKNRAMMERRGYSYLKGYYTGTYSRSIDSTIDTIGLTERLPLVSSAKNELCSFLEYCDNKKINVVFVYFPRLSKDDRIDKVYQSNTIGDYVRSFGYDYLNFVTEIDLSNSITNEDYYNSEHLNVEGQEKFTDTLSKIIVEKYGISPTILNEVQKVKWNKSVEFTNRFVEYAKEKTRENGIDSDESYLYEDYNTVQIIESLNE